MPPRKGHEYSVVCRRIKCIDGKVPVRSELSPRFAFGRAVPRVARADGATKMFAGPDALYLRGGPSEGAPPLVADLSLSAGDDISYSLSYGISYEEPSSEVDVGKRRARHGEFWTGWCSTPGAADALPR